MTRDLAITQLAANDDTLAGLAALLVEATAEGASVGFLHPLATAVAEDYFRGALEQVGRGERVIFGARDGVRLVGTASLTPARYENQPHRADVQKLLVAVSHRRRGVARQLMAEVEAWARAAGRWLLVLDTIEDSEAVHLYEGLGWTRSGIIPDYAQMPDGALAATAVYWKRLR